MTHGDIKKDRYIIVEQGVSDRSVEHGRRITKQLKHK